MRYLIVIATLMLSFNAFASFSESEEAFEEVQPQAFHRVRPCGSWKYSSQASGYVCSFNRGSFRAADHYEIERLERRIEDLERRLAQAEQDLEKQN